MFPLLIAAAEPDDLLDMPLEGLADITVSAASRHEERLLDVAASVYVITAEQIRYAGARTLPEALRLAPNLYVARSEEFGYLIASRGLNRSGNKMLVMIDGRIIHSPLTAGVFWDAQDVLLEDVKRIEVISGPGGALWGSNAVNGVINVVTHAPEVTQGMMARVGGGDDGERYAVARYGGTSGQTSYRLYGRSIRERSDRRSDGRVLGDALDRHQIGFRADWVPRPATRLTLQGDAYEARGATGSTGSQGSRGDPLRRNELSGFNLLGRWTQPTAGLGTLSLQAYFDQVQRHHDRYSTFDAYRRNTVSVELQHSLAAWGAHRITWGTGLRYVSDRVENGPYPAVFPEASDQNWAHAFVQHEYAWSRQVKLSTGLKVERNPYTGAEAIPTVRLSWAPMPQHLLWAALSRAVRAPTKYDRDRRQSETMRSPYITLLGGPGFRSEIANVAEFGWRAQPDPHWSFSLSAFHQRYDRLRSQEIVPYTETPYGELIGNGIFGMASGLDFWTRWQPTTRWTFAAGGNWLNQKLYLRPGSQDALNRSAAGNDPKFQWMLRAGYRLADDIDLEMSLRRVGPLPHPAVTGYTTAGMRLGWALQPGLELEFVVDNLFDRRYSEFNVNDDFYRFAIDAPFPPRPVQRRQIFLGLIWRL